MPTAGRTGFTNLPPTATGIFFTNHLSAALAENNRILENGSGVALGDVDGDGWCDVYFCRLEGPNVLYRNQGNWRFEDVTAGAGVACPDQFSTGAVFADIDGDGDLDLLVNSIGGGTRGFRNDGQGRFSEDTNCGLIRQSGSTSMALADIDGDGDLDLYVANYRTTTVRDNPPEDIRISHADGRIAAHPPERFEIVLRPNGEPVVYEKGEPDVLYLNDGTGHFTPVSWTGGRFLDEDGKPLAAPPRHWGLTVTMRDFSGDGAPDIYVCNDFIDSPDDVWVNDGKGRFRAIGKLALRNTSWSSMAVDFADINRDGLVDFFVVDMLSRDHRLRQTQRANLDMASVGVRIGEIDNRPQHMRNTLFLNRGDGTFAEMAQLSGLQASEWSWSVVFLDIDLDGYEDALVTNGNEHDVLDADTAVRAMALTQGVPRERQPKTLRMYPRLATANLAFRNRGDLTFAEVGSTWGFDAASISQGMALADLDNDGDLDVVVNNLNSTAAIYRNETIAPRVAVRLRGRAPNAQGIGAKIKVSDGPVAQAQEFICGGRYLSGDDPVRVFAAGSLTNRLAIEVIWRSGRQSVVVRAEPNRIYELDEATSLEVQSSKFEVPSPKSEVHPFFRDVSHLINHVHHETGFDDFARQPLLPHRFSQLGPGAAWFDLNQDGWDDLIIGAGRGGALAVFVNNGRGGFKPLANDGAVAPALGDQSSVIGWNSKSSSSTLLVGSSNFEQGGTSIPSVVGCQIVSGKLQPSFEFTGQTASVGPMALADTDGDGDLDLFVGGRLNPGRYPEPATSRIYRNDSGEFRLDPDASRAFVNIGLVSGAVFSDLDGDGDPDLVLACDWGPIRIFRNERGKLIPWNPPIQWESQPTLHSRPSTLNPQPSTLNQLAGRWNGVTTADFDGDGRLDIVASNWGRNTKYQRHLDTPLQLYYGDFDGNGTVDIVESYFDRAINDVVPWRGLISMSRAIPPIRERVPTFRAYGSASVKAIIGDTLDAGRELRVNTLDSMLFLNRNGRFAAQPLPIEAQFAPAFGVNAADFDGDGNEDIFLSQNFFAVHPETSRYDAGRGLWLRGDGHGGFTAVSSRESGVLVYGEQRGSALSDYDGDGRVDLVVTQNGAETKLYRNERAKRGLRVELKGPAGNPTGVGAIIRLVCGERFGPAREIHAGSSYWSQDSARPTIGSSETPTGLWLRWPDGQVRTANLPSGALKVRVHHSGRVEAWK